MIDKHKTLHKSRFFSALHTAVVISLVWNLSLNAQSNGLKWDDDLRVPEHNSLNDAYIMDRVSISYNQILIYNQRIGRVYSESELLTIIDRVLKDSGHSLSRQQWIQIDSVIFNEQGDSFDLALSIQPESPNQDLLINSRKSQFNGVLGLVPNNKGTLYLVGDIQLWIPNLSLEGQDLFFSYQRTDLNYSTANFLYNHPIRANKWSIEAGMLFEQRDSLYQKIDLQFGQRFQIRSNFSLHLGVALEKLENTGSIVNPLANNQSFSLTGGFEWSQYAFSQRDNSNFAQLPTLSFRSGFTGLESNFKSYIQLKKQQSTKASTNEASQMKSDLTEQWVVKARIHWGLLYGFNTPSYAYLQQSLDWNHAPHLLWSDISVFGGANSLAGFYERQFSASTVYLLKGAFGYQMNPNNRWEVFVSGGFYNQFVAEGLSEPLSTLLSVGVTYRFETELGTIHLSIANPISGDYEGAKVHLLNGW